MHETSEYDYAEFTTNVVLDDGDPGDHCLFCEEHIGFPPDMDAHAEHCPYTTGLWTMDEAVQEYHCDGCGEDHTVQYVCARCRHFFENGDPYRLIDDETGLVVPWVEAPGWSTAICPPCAQRQADALIERLG